MQGTQLRYVIKFVADMDKAVKFHRDVLGLKLKFESPGWSALPGLVRSPDSEYWQGLSPQGPKPNRRVGGSSPM